jgi:mannose-6-phosphate isomerase
MDSSRRLLRPFILDCPVQSYAWGSTSALASLQQRPASGGPEAELWIGAHPNAPSLHHETKVPLDVLIGGSAESALGSTSVDAFGASLPFLLKVLAAEAPLSLQAHPSRSQAEAGFEAEEAAGIAMSSPTRVFKDRNHKPELICALTEFEAMCGFRPVVGTTEILESLGTPSTLGMAARLRVEPAARALRTIVVDLLQADADRAASICEEVEAACRTHEGPWRAEADLVVRLTDAYPGDVGAVISLLLNRVVLQPGEALVLGAGNLHAYIRGVGVELMANSDNVLRGGLTAKHVDVPGLIQVVDWTPLADPVHRPLDLGPIKRYPSPSPEFRLDCVEVGLDVDGSVSLPVIGPELLWCEVGKVSLTSDGTPPLTLVGGVAVFVPAATEEYRLRGSGRLYRATIGL